MNNTFIRYVIAKFQIKKLQIGETISDEKHVSGTERTNVGTCERG
jgi:hypothetical protein